MKQVRMGITTLLLIGALLGASACATGGSTPAVWHNYPTLFANPTPKPFLVIMCKVNDNPVEPSGLFNLAQRFFTVGGMGTGGLADYFADNSYGAISLVNTKVVGWYTASFSTTDLNNPDINGKNSLSGPDNRYKRVQLCADAIPDSEMPYINFSDYAGIIAVTKFSMTAAPAPSANTP